MKKLSKKKSVFTFTSYLVIILLQSFIFFITWQFHYRELIEDIFYQKGTAVMILVFVMLYGTFTAVYNGFKVEQLRITDIIYSHVISLVFVGILSYFQIILIARKLLDAYGVILMVMAQICCSVLWAFITHRIFVNICPPVNLIVVYGNEDVEKLIAKIKVRKEIYRVKDIIDIDEGFDKIIKKVGQDDALVLYDIKSGIRGEFVKYCYEKSIKMYITPKITDVIVGGASKFHMFDTPLIYCENFGLSSEQAFFKRIVDIIISVLSIVLLSPIMIITAFAIKVSDGGPVIFKQERLTKDNKIFKIYKFRSMIVNAEEDGVARLASKEDDRITKVGKFIRKCRIDELPQLFNVLKGEMSVVGPRPERPEIAKQYLKVMPEFSYRTKVKAGLTGYAQIMGKYNTTPYDKLKLDLMYIENYSLVMDIKIILKTIKVLFFPESAEGVDVEESAPELIAFGEDENE